MDWKTFLFWNLSLRMPTEASFLSVFLYYIPTFLQIANLLVFIFSFFSQCCPFWPLAFFVLHSTFPLLAQICTSHCFSSTFPSLSCFICCFSVLRSLSSSSFSFFPYPLLSFSSLSSVYVSFLAFCPLTPSLPVPSIPKFALLPLLSPVTTIIILITDHSRHNHHYHLAPLLVRFLHLHSLLHLHLLVHRLRH